MSRNRRFYTFLTGSFFASFGGWINFLAILNIATYRFNANPFDLVILSAALLIPPILLTRTVSRVCSRYASTRVLIVALTLTLGTTTALLWVGNFVAFLLIVALKSAALGFTDPSETLYVTTRVDEAQQSRAFRLLSLAQSVAKICAPAAGGIIGAWAGDSHTMIASIVLIAAAILLMLASAPNGKAAATTAPPAPGEQAPQRARFAGPIVPLLLCVGIYFALAAAVNNQFPLMLKNHGFNQSVLGIVVSCSALGGMLGSLLPMGRNAREAGLGALHCTRACHVYRVHRHWRNLLAAVASGRVDAGDCFLRDRPRRRSVSGSSAGCSSPGVSRIRSRAPGASLQSAGMLMQFIAPCFGAVLTSLLSTSDVFIVLGAVAMVCLATVGVRFGKQQPTTAPTAAALTD